MPHEVIYTRHSDDLQFALFLQCFQTYCIIGVYITLREIYYGHIVIVITKLTLKKISL